MKIIQQLALVGLGALAGVGAGYAGFKPDQQGCQKFYAQEMSRIEEEFKDLPVSPGVASGKDFTLEYVVSKDAGFKGVIFTDSVSGKKGVIAKAQFFGGNNYSMPFVDVDKALEAPSAAVPMQPQVRLYVGKGK